MRTEESPQAWSWPVQQILRQVRDYVGLGWSILMSAATKGYRPMILTIRLIFGGTMIKVYSTVSQDAPRRSVV